VQFDCHKYILSLGGGVFKITVAWIRVRLCVCTVRAEEKTGFHRPTLCERVMANKMCVVSLWPIFDQHFQVHPAKKRQQLLLNTA